MVENYYYLFFFQIRVSETSGSTSAQLKLVEVPCQAAGLTEWGRQSSDSIMNRADVGEPSSSLTSAVVFSDWRGEQQTHGFVITVSTHEYQQLNKFRFNNFIQSFLTLCVSNELDSITQMLFIFIVYLIFSLNLLFRSANSISTGYKLTVKPTSDHSEPYTISLFYFSTISWIVFVIVLCWCISTFIYTIFSSTYTDKMHWFV